MLKAPARAGRPVKAHGQPKNSPPTERPSKPPTEAREGSAAAGPVLIDSGPLLALFNAADHWHGPVLAWLRGHPAVALVSTWPVLTEVCALLARRIHNAAALDLLRWVQRGGLEVDLPSGHSLADVLLISERFADLPLDVADASIAEAASRRRIRQVLTLDTDFDVYRDKAGKPLIHVLHSVRAA